MSDSLEPSQTELGLGLDVMGQPMTKSAASSPFVNSALEEEGTVIE